MSRVFISYSRRDRDSVERIVEALRQQPSVDVWIDQRDIPVSVPWFSEIEDAIRGCALLLLCDSPAWRDSANCAIEHQLAAELSKETIRVDVATADPREAAERVAAALLAMDPREPLRGSLLLRAGQWSRSKSDSALARGRELKQYSDLLPQLSSAPPPEVATFVARSVRRRRRRRAFTAAGVALTLLLAGTVELFNDANNLTQKNFAAADRKLETLASEDELRTYNIYAALQAAASTSASLENSYSYRANLIQDLATPVPLAFGHAAPVALPLRAQLRSRQAGLEAIAARTSGRVTITTITGEVRRFIDVDGAPTSIAWNADGTLLAVATPGGVQLLDVRTGMPVATLLGFPRVVGRLRWVDHNAKVVATSVTGDTATWRVRAGELVSQRPSWWFMSASAIPGTDLVGALTRNGQLVVIDPDKRRVVTTRRTAFASLGIAVVGGPDQTLLVAKTNPSTAGGGIDVITSDSWRQQWIAVPRCAVGGVTYAASIHSAVVACGSAGFGLVDLANEKVTIVPEAEPVNSVTIRGREAIGASVAGAIEDLNLATARSSPIDAPAQDCAGADLYDRVSPDGRYLLSAGYGANEIGCLQRADFKSGTLAPHWDVIPTAPDGSAEARGLAFTPNGTYLAYGFSNGAIEISGVADLNPRWEWHDAGAEIRGLVFTSGGADLVAVTRAGAIYEYDTAPEHLTVPQLDAIAKHRVTIAESSGMYIAP